MSWTKAGMHWSVRSPDAAPGGMRRGLSTTVETQRAGIFSYRRSIHVEHSLNPCHQSFAGCGCKGRTLACLLGGSSSKRLGGCRSVVTLAEGNGTVSNGATLGKVFSKLSSASKDLEEPADGFDRIEFALEALEKGTPVVVLDDEDRENEGDLIVPADRVSCETMAFIVEHTSGVICVGMTGSDLDRLKIPLMVPPVENEEAMSTAFTVTVDLREGTTTGISAEDRTATIRALADARSVPEDFKRPGHIFPLRYRDGGVLCRPGHTEASVDLSRLAGCAPAGVLCEIVNKDGTMSRTPELLAFSKKYKLPCITIADLVRYRLKRDKIVQRTAAGVLSTRYGEFTAYSYKSLLDGQEHVALVLGGGSPDTPILTRIQNESILGDLFGSQRCGTSSQLDDSLQSIVEEGRGILVYLRGQQKRGIGLAEELIAFHGPDGADAQACDMLQQDDGGFSDDLRDYAVAAHIIKDLGAHSLKMMTNNVLKVECMTAHGLLVTDQIPLESGSNFQPSSSHKRNVRSFGETHFA